METQDLGTIMKLLPVNQVTTCKCMSSIRNVQRAINCDFVLMVHFENPPSLKILSFPLFKCVKTPYVQNQRSFM